jgi:hypothetical protein
LIAGGVTTAALVVVAVAVATVPAGPAPRPVGVELSFCTTAATLFFCAVSAMGNPLMLLYIYCKVNKKPAEAG